MDFFFQLNFLPSLLALLAGGLDLLIIEAPKFSKLRKLRTPKTNSALKVLKLVLKLVLKISPKKYPKEAFICDDLSSQRRLIDLKILTRLIL